MANLPLQWGLLSTARINRALIHPLQKSKRGTVAAVASRSQDRADAYAREHDIPRAYGSYEAMLADPDLDVIYISLPNGLHAEWTVKALRAGKHVLCEKPLAVSVEEVDSICAAAEETGKLVMEAFMYRHHPQTFKVKELLDGGAVGEVRHISGIFTFFLTRPDDIRLVAELGGGSIWDLGCYPISYARWMLGVEPEEVFGWQITGPGGVDETFSGQLRFPGSGGPPVYCQFASSFRMSRRIEMVFTGTEGALTVPVPFSPGKRSSLLLERDGKAEKIPVRGQDLYLMQVENMADAILEGKATRIPLEDSRGTVGAISALLQSASTGAPVKL